MVGDLPTEKVKFPRSLVRDVFDYLQRHFDPAPAFGRPRAKVDRMCAVGGYRRGKEAMKDLEILYVPRVSLVEDPGDLFGAKRPFDCTEQLIEELRAAGVLRPRLKENGALSAWGPKNKHAVHVESGLPIDFFAASRENYFNRLVVTTGPRELNVRIATLARERQWEWEVYEAGFVPVGKTWDTAPRERRTMHSEQEVFAFVDLPYLRPEERASIPL